MNSFHASTCVWRLKFSIEKLRSSWGKKVCSIPSVSEANLGKRKIKKKIYFNFKIVAFLLL